MGDDSFDIAGLTAFECLSRGRELKSVIRELRRDGRLPEARALLEKYLVTLGVLRTNDDSFSIGGFAGGSYSYSWPVIFLDAYLRILIEYGEGETAQRLVAESLEQGSLLDDSVIMLTRRIASRRGRKDASRFPVLRVKKSALGSRYLSLPTVEMTALAYLKDELDWDGVVAEVDFWRRIAGFLSGDVSEDRLAEAYMEATGESLPPTFGDFLLTNAASFKAACCAPRGATFGRVGYPDLVLYDSTTLGRLLLVEVKDVRDRLRPHQEAVLNSLVACGLPCKLLKFVK